MPEFKEVQQFPSKDDDLTKLPVFSWGKWLFTSLNPKLGAEVWLGEMMERLNWLPLHEFKYDRTLSRDFHESTLGTLL
jgi:choline monooxygenase